MAHPFRDYIHNLLECYNYEDAQMLAELAYDDCPSEETALLFATTLYRAGKLHEATYFIERRCSFKSSTNYKLVFLHAQILLELNKIDEAEQVLLADAKDWLKSEEEVVVEFQRRFDATTAPHALRLLGKITLRNRKYTLAHAALRLAIQLNPLWWSTYTLLCKLSPHEQSPPPTTSDLFTLFCRNLEAAETLSKLVEGKAPSHRLESILVGDTVVVQRTRAAARGNETSDQSVNDDVAGRSISSSVIRITASEFRAQVSPGLAYFVAGEEFTTTDHEYRSAEIGHLPAQRCNSVLSRSTLLQEGPNDVLPSGSTSVEKGLQQKNTVDLFEAASPTSVVDDNKSVELLVHEQPTFPRSSSRRCAQVASERIKITVQQKRRGQKGSSSQPNATPLFKSPLTLHSTTSTAVYTPAELLEISAVSGSKMPFRAGGEPASVATMRDDAAFLPAEPFATAAVDSDDSNSLDLSMLDTPHTSLQPEDQETLPSRGKITAWVMLPPQQNAPPTVALSSSSFRGDAVGGSDSGSSGAFDSISVAPKKPQRGGKRLNFSRDSDIDASPNEAQVTKPSAKRVRIHQKPVEVSNTVKKVAETLITPSAQLQQVLPADAEAVQRRQQPNVRNVDSFRKKNLWHAIDRMQQHASDDAEPKHESKILLINYDELNRGSQQLIRIAESFCSYARIIRELERFDFSRALALVRRLPAGLSNTAIGHYLAGQAYFVQTEYSRAVKEFEQMIACGPYGTRGLDFLSSALWHEDRKQELATLAKFMRTHYPPTPTTPETYVVFANAFSLTNKDHTLAIRMLRRAIQLRPDYYYAHNLLGHEYSAREQPDDAEKALQCFRLAIQLDPFSYYAYYGMAAVHYKKCDAGGGGGSGEGDDDDKHQQQHAYAYFKQAYEICPSNPVLMVHLALSSHRLHANSRTSSLLQKDEALVLLRRAARLHPHNHLVKFQLAQVLFSRQMYDDAVVQLLELSDLLPREALVYFLLGKVYESRPETQHKALRCFSRACDLDPKGRSNNNFLKEAFDKIHAVVVA